jgi:alkylhydroperoxidase family enzyme
MELVLHTTETAPEASRQVLEGIQETFGFIPNLAASAAGSPALVSGFDGLRRAAAATVIDPVDREVAGLAVGVHARNHYGVAFHSTMLGRLGVGEREIEAMRAGTPPADPHLAAVYEFAAEVTTRRGAVEDKTVTRLHEAGFSTAGILDILTECAFATVVGLIDNVAGQVPLDPFLQPSAWSAP